MIHLLRTSQDVTKAISRREVVFLESLEVVNEAALKTVTAKIKGLLGRNKKLEVMFFERP